MLKKRKDVFVAVCSHCESSDEIETDDFIDAVDYLKGEDWLIKKVDGEWKHYCYDCRDNADI